MKATRFKATHITCPGSIPRLRSAERLTSINPFPFFFHTLGYSFSHPLWISQSRLNTPRRMDTLIAPSGRHTHPFLSPATHLFDPCTYDPPPIPCMATETKPTHRLSLICHKSNLSTLAAYRTSVTPNVHTRGTSLISLTLSLTTWRMRKLILFSFPRSLCFRPHRKAVLREDAGMGGRAEIEHVVACAKQGVCYILCVTVLTMYQ